MPVNCSVLKFQHFMTPASAGTLFCIPTFHDTSQLYEMPFCYIYDICINHIPIHSINSHLSLENKFVHFNLLVQNILITGANELF